MTIDDYFLKTEQIIVDFDLVVWHKTEKKKTDDTFGIFKGLLYFEEGRLEFIEVVRIIAKKALKIKYKYHFMTNENKMIFRYDNVKHHPNISTFPHHKHIDNDIIPSSEPDFMLILSEIREFKNLNS
ncbi:MAG: hypothetical protein DRI95_03505 [Bacteroidetes bacterium]|nr:MAG: hypothetical protein DRI95_03505 [Bacteroidota bacterium]